MLAILFSLGAQRCGLDSAVVERIVPALPLRPASGSPPAFAGTFSYRGAHVPVVDLVQLNTGRSAQPQLSSRIIIACHPDDSGTPRFIGLLAERVNEVLSVSGQSTGSAPETFRVVSLSELVSAELFSQLLVAEAAS